MNWGVLATVLAVLLYWILIGKRENPPRRPSLPLLAVVGLALLLTVWTAWLERPSYSYKPVTSPVAIAIAFDLSPSMLAIPDPASGLDQTPRYRRGINTLLELLGEFEERQINVLVSIIGFTFKAEVIMGWESNVSQVREMLQYVVTPELFTSSGTSIEAAAKSLIQAFKTLPENMRDDTKRVAVLVSDGEDTSTYSYIDFILEELQKNSFDMITLQTGLLEQNEGVPRYGEFGEFVEFEPMSGGKLYTVPDVDMMMRLSVIPDHRGLYVRAETPGAATRMLDFITGSGMVNTGLDLKLMLILGLFVLASLLYVRQLM